MSGEEISVIDLFSVIIRYRRMIAIVSLVLFILCIPIIILLPDYKNKQFDSESESEAVVTCKVSQDIALFAEDVEVNDMVLSIIKDPVLVQSVLKESGIDEINGINLKKGTEEQQLFAIYNRFILNKDSDGRDLGENKRIYNLEIIDGMHRIVVKLDDPAKAKIFLNTLVVNANMMLRKLLLPIAETEMQTYESLLTLEYPRQVIEENLLLSFKRYISAERFSSGSVETLFVVQEPYVLTRSFDVDLYRVGTIKRAVIVLIVGFFLTIFLSFVLAWLEIVKSDPESVKKIQAALKRERIK